MPAFGAMRKVGPPRIQSVEIPAPVGGLNALDPATALPEGDCLALYNLTAAELGQRVRQGWSEWAIGLSGAADSQVRSILPFSGSHKSGSTDKLFACTSSGIWDVTGQGAVTTAWVGTTAYVAGSVTTPSSYVSNGGNVYVCIQSGTSANAGGPTGTGSAIVDGTCKWNYIGSNTVPTKLVSFGTTTGDAGYGICHAFATTGGRYLAYCDEVNGLYLWSENSATWSQPVLGTTQAWAASTTYIFGDKVINSGNTYTCTTGGLSSATVGPTTVGAGITDGTAVWTGASGVTANAIGPSLNDQHNSLSSNCNPANFAFCVSLFNRLWFVERDSTRGWYLPFYSILGTATSFDFGPQSPKGGPLAGLWAWSYEAGQGMDTLTVAVTTSGDVVIYGGTDPSSSTTWSVVGKWNVGGVPYGRRIATDIGGELQIMSLKGVVRLSKLVAGVPALAGGVGLYDSDKIGPLFNVDAQAYLANQGWAIGENPGDNALMCLVPSSGSGAAAKPYVMSLSKKSWSVYRNQPILSMGTWNGTMYFGTPDGRIAKVNGYLDGLIFGNSSSFSPITWSFVSGFTDLGRMTMKQVQSIIPMLEAGESSPPINAEAKYNLDISEAAFPTGTGSNAANTWDHAVWDSSVWGGGYAEVAPIIGAVGMGRTVAVAVCGLASSRTSVVAVGLMYLEGGLF